MGRGLDSSALFLYYSTVVNQPRMKSYPLGIDNPIAIRQVYGTTRWALYWKENWQKIITVPSQFTAYDVRRTILKSMGYNA